jgi:hypothetical protein
MPPHLARDVQAPGPVLGEFPLLKLKASLTRTRLRLIASTLASSGCAMRQFVWIITRAEKVSCVIAI